MVMVTQVVEVVEVVEVVVVHLADHALALLLQDLRVLRVDEHLLHLKATVGRLGHDLLLEGFEVLLRGVSHKN